MTALSPPTSGLKAWVTERVSRSPGPLLKLRATRFGLERRPEVELYYEAGDPHSHMAALILPRLQQYSRFPVRVRLVGSSDPVLYPEAQKQRSFALIDYQRVAPAMGMRVPLDPQVPPEACRVIASCILQHAIEEDRFAELEPEVARLLFSADKPGLQALQEKTIGWSRPEITAKIMAENEQRRFRLGHYLPGMWQFRGDWFWGVDRLVYLKEALEQAGGWRGPKAPPWSRDPTQANLPSFDGELPELEFFFSFRSPYSYLAAMQLRDAMPELGLQLRVRPVLPMAMRGFRIPRCKGLYIVRDARREGERRGIPFGRLADPIGPGAERCLNTFRLAEGPAQQLRFCCEAGKAVWSEAVDVATDDGLRYVCEQAGIDWNAAKQNLEAGSDLIYAEENREALFAAGYWGVPCFKLGGFTTWGRDRFWMIQEIVRRHRGE